MTQSGSDVVQEWDGVALASHEATRAHLVTPALVWEILDGFPHGGLDAGIPAMFDQYFPKLQADGHDWHAQPDACVNAGDTRVALGHDSGTWKTTDVHLVAPLCHVWTRTHGTIARLRPLTDTATCAQAMQQE